MVLPQASPLERRPSGFTMIEMMVVIALVGLLAALAGPAVMYGTRRARANNAIFEATAMMTAAQMRATSTGIPQYIVWYGSDEGAGVVLVERPDPQPNWASVDVTNAEGLAAGLGQIVEHTRFDSSVLYLPLDPPPVRVMSGGFPPPFSSVPTTGTGSGMLAACTFCTGASGGALGAVRFAPNGSASFPTTTAQGGSIVIGNEASEGTAPSVKVLAITAPSGMVRIFQ